MGHDGRFPDSGRLEGGGNGCCMGHPYVPSRVGWLWQEFAGFVLIASQILRRPLLDHMLNTRLEDLTEGSYGYPASTGPRVVLVVDPPSLCCPTGIGDSSEG